MRTRIVLANDHALVRHGFRALLAAIPDFEVVSEAANGREALQLIRTQAPDVVLMDIAMPELNGLDATAHALREVLQLIAEGRSTREMAARLNLSVKTIETHRAQLMQRLDIFDVAGLTRHALRIGLIDPER